LNNLPPAGELAGPAPTEAELKADLEEALTIVFADRDGRHANEDVAHSKALLLMVITSLLIVVLAGFQNAILLLLGALGGFLSRLARSVGPASIVHHWIELFLSPLAGALAGWAGVLIAAALIEARVLDLGTALQWDDPYALFALELAFLLGFSERLFSQVTSALQPQGANSSSPANNSSSPVSNCNPDSSSPAAAKCRSLGLGVVARADCFLVRAGHRPVDFLPEG
jgi:hypothetical protein